MEIQIFKKLSIFFYAKSRYFYVKKALNNLLFLQTISFQKMYIIRLAQFITKKNVSIINCERPRSVDNFENCKIWYLSECSNF